MSSVAFGSTCVSTACGFCSDGKIPSLNSIEIALPGVVAATIDKNVSRSLIRNRYPLSPMIAVVLTPFVLLSMNSAM